LTSRLFGFQQRFTIEPQQKLEPRVSKDDQVYVGDHNKARHSLHSKPTYPFARWHFNFFLRAMILWHYFRLPGKIETILPIVLNFQLNCACF